MTLANSEDVISLKHVRQLIEKISVRELPGIVPFAVDEYLIKLSTSQWEKICLSNFEAIKAHLQSLQKELCQKYFGRFQISGLCLAARLVCPGS
jgi:hypothetical protein